jgi:hypothetical protein
VFAAWLMDHSEGFKTSVGEVTADVDTCMWMKLVDEEVLLVYE